MGYLVIGFLLALAIALMAYEAYHPRRLRNSMDMCVPSKEGSVT